MTPHQRANLLTLLALLFGLALALAIGNQIAIMLAICDSRDWLERASCRSNDFAGAMAAVAVFLVWLWGILVVRGLWEVKSMLGDKDEDDD